MEPRSKIAQLHLVVQQNAELLDSIVGKMERLEVAVARMEQRVEDLDRHWAEMCALRCGAPPEQQKSPIRRVDVWAAIVGGAIYAVAQFIDK